MSLIKVSPRVSGDVNPANFITYIATLNIDAYTVDIVNGLIKIYTANKIFEINYATLLADTLEDLLGPLYLAARLYPDPSSDPNTPNTWINPAIVSILLPAPDDPIHFSDVNFGKVELFNIRIYGNIATVAGLLETQYSTSISGGSGSAEPTPGDGSGAIITSLSQFDIVDQIFYYTNTIFGQQKIGDKTSA